MNVIDGRWPNGNKRLRIYTKDKIFHDEFGPALQCWYEHNVLQTECYYFNGKKHREGQPAQRVWYESGKIMSESYFLLGALHCFEWAAHREWYESGQLRVRECWNAGQRSCETGPAVQQWNEDGSLVVSKYYLYGVCLSINEWRDLAKPKGVIDAISILPEAIFTALYECYAAE